MDASFGAGTKVGFVPEVLNTLDAKWNGEALVLVVSATLGLKSNVSDALKVPPLSSGMSLKLLAGYESTVNKSPVSFAGTVNLSKITLNLLEGIVAPSFLTIRE